MAAKLKYTLSGCAPLIKDLKAVNDTYAYGEVIVAGAAEGGGVRSAAAGIVDAIIGVSNEAVTLAGTQAAGTVGNLKVIVNPDAVYAVEYDLSGRITYVSANDTSIVFASAGAGWANAGAGWLWSYNTGALDYVVSSSVGGGNTTAVTVTGTSTSSTTGVLLQPSRTGQEAVLTLNSDGLTINSDITDTGVAGTNGITGVILETRIESATHGSEILDPVVHNQKTRHMNVNTSYKDKTRAFAYVRFKHALAV
jgi:hypothetical protein